jgi:hypothetical protein
MLRPEHLFSELVHRAKAYKSQLSGSVNAFKCFTTTLVSRRRLFPGVGINPIGFLSHGFLEILALHTSSRRLQGCDTLIASVRV